MFGTLESGEDVGLGVNYVHYVRQITLQLIVVRQQKPTIALKIARIRLLLFSDSLHCKENPIYVLFEKKLRGLSPSFHIHVSVSNSYIPTIGLPIFLQKNRQTDRGDI
jgi:hypothetical protein